MIFVPSLRTFLACLCLSLGAFRLSAENINYFFIFDDYGANIGHSISLIDSNGQVKLLGEGAGWYTINEYQDPVTGEVIWQTWAYPPYEATGQWYWAYSQLSGSLDTIDLTLTPGTQFYLYDQTSNQISDPLWVDQGLSGVVTNLPATQIPELPVKVFGNKIKVLGKGEFKGKTRFDAPVRITPAGDISMGGFTREPTF